MSMRHCTCCDRTLTTDQFPDRRHICGTCQEANRSRHPYRTDDPKPRKLRDAYGRYADSLRKAMRSWLRVWKSYELRKPIDFNDLPAGDVTFINEHPKDFGYAIRSGRDGRAELVQLGYDDLAIPLILDSERRCVICDKVKDINNYRQGEDTCNTCLEAAKRAYKREHARKVRLRRQNHRSGSSRARSTAGS